MAKVYEFPTHKGLPENVKMSLYEVARAYVEVLEYVIANLTGEDPSMEEVDEWIDLLSDELQEALDAAIFDSQFK